MKYFDCEISSSYWALRHSIGISETGELWGFELLPACPHLLSRPCLAGLLLPSSIPSLAWPAPRSLHWPDPLLPAPVGAQPASRWPSFAIPCWPFILWMAGLAPPPPGSENHEEIFTSLFSDSAISRTRPTVTKFIKKLDEITEVNLPPSLPRKSAIILAERGLVGQFTGLWPSLRSVQKWVERNWSAMI